MNGLNTEGRARLMNGLLTHSAIMLAEKTAECEALSLENAILRVRLRITESRIAKLRSLSNKENP